MCNVIVELGILAPPVVGSSRSYSSILQQEYFAALDLFLPPAG